MAYGLLCSRIPYHARSFDIDDSGHHTYLDYVGSCFGFLGGRIRMIEVTVIGICAAARRAHYMRERFINSAQSVRYVDKRTPLNYVVNKG
jgi:hypothetical protein